MGCGSSSSTTRTIQEPINQQQRAQLEWPLPEKEFERDFVPTYFEDDGRYSLVKNRYERSSLTTHRRTKVIAMESPFTQRIDKKSNYVQSNVLNSTHVQTKMKTETNLKVEIAPSVETRKLLTKLNATHAASNELIQQRLEGVSNESKRIFKLIMDETAEEQKQFLEYAQKIRLRREEVYSEWLQRYVDELDRWKTGELAELQEKLEYSKKDIEHMLQQKLALLNRNVDAAQTQVFREERNRQAEETGKIMSDVQEISQLNQMHHIDTEANTNIHMNILANAGNREPSKVHPMFIDESYPFLEQHR